MSWPAPDEDHADDACTPPPLERLSPQERAVYEVLAEHRGRVVGRDELSRLAGLTGLSERRCDSLIVGVRRRIGPERIRTVRRRGWMLLD